MTCLNGGYFATLLTERFQLFARATRLVNCINSIDLRFAGSTVIVPFNCPRVYSTLSSGNFISGVGNPRFGRVPLPLLFKTNRESCVINNAVGYHSTGMRPSNRFKPRGLPTPLLPPESWKTATALLSASATYRCDPSFESANPFGVLP